MLLPLLAGTSVVIPVFNSSAALPLLIESLSHTMKLLQCPFEIILIDDGSSDLSWDVISALQGDCPWIVGISMMRNYGQHNAVLAGIRAARYETIVTMDDDLQHPPAEIPKLLARLDESCDVVYGPPEREQHGFFRNLASIITKIGLQSALGSHNVRAVCAWRVFRTRLRDSFASYHSPFVNIDVLLTWGTTRFAAVRVRHEPRQIGKSNYTLNHLVRHALTMMTGFSAKPLHFASIIGLTFALFGIGVLFYVIIRYVASGVNVEGFAFLASIISIFSGAQLFTLGIIGEYLSRVHFRTMEKPTYVIRESTNQL